MTHPRTDPSITAKRLEIAEAAIARHRAPSRELEIVGVTGTNGKTTTVHLLRALLDAESSPCASIGTLGVLRGARGQVVPGGLGLTTPGPDELQRVLRELVDSGVKRVAMEVSSHALDQHRIHGVTLAAAVFTNLTRDHLDYHGTMEDYFAAKAKLLDYLAPHGYAIINADEPAWRSLRVPANVLTFGVDAGDVRAEQVAFHSSGSDWTLRYGDRSADVRLPLLGDFNVYNALAAAASALALGDDVHRVADALTRAPQVPGRLEVIATPPSIIRDYAHTPDAIERSLTALRPFVSGKLIMVFGAGGDRDPGKRPLMGAAAERGADHVIVTSDNPRTEDPDAIIDAIERGMNTAHERITDRREAIARAIDLAEPGDILLLAGKGHETYQVIGTEKHPFDERDVVAELLRVRA